MPRARWAEGGQLLRPLRMIKDEREIALLAEAARRTDESWEEFLGLLDHGVDRVGGSRPPDGIAGGARSAAGVLQRRQRPNGASPHQTASDRVIGPGDAVVCDWGGTLQGYNSDVTRTVHVASHPPSSSAPMRPCWPLTRPRSRRCDPACPARRSTAPRGHPHRSRVWRRLHSSYRARAGALPARGAVPGGRKHPPAGGGDGLQR